jgi:medium-chain acyl-[acyl-carrier-protein] hydrolase
MAESAWFVCPRPNPNAGIRLFCFPYAGGGVPVFRGWAEGLPDAEVWVASLPGRWSRLQEQPLTDLPALVEQLERALRPLASSRFALFGHSLGARVAFELARRLRHRGGPMPDHLFVSACPAPQWPLSHPPLHTLPREAFVAALSARHALLEEVLSHPGLLDIVLPALRADLTVWETAAYIVESPLNIPITAFGGMTDPQVSEAELAGWNVHSGVSFTQLIFPGDHLFLHSSQAGLLQAIGHALSENKSSFILSKGDTCV